MKTKRSATRAADTPVVLGRDGEVCAPAVPRRWAWHYRTLTSLRDRLLGTRRALIRNAAEPLEPHSLDEADSATDEFDHDLALAQLSAGQDALYEINQALDRIVTGRYGICEETGKAIPAARLRAVPWTRFTRGVEELLERRGISRPPRLSQARTVRESGRVWLALETEPDEAEEKAPPPPKAKALARLSPPPGGPSPETTHGKQSPRKTRKKKGEES